MDLPVGKRLVSDPKDHIPCKKFRSLVLSGPDRTFHLIDQKTAMILIVFPQIHIEAAHIKIIQVRAQDICLPACKGIPVYLVKLKFVDHPQGNVGCFRLLIDFKNTLHQGRLTDNTEHVIMDVHRIVQIFSGHAAQFGKASAAADGIAELPLKVCIMGENLHDTIDQFRK